MIKYPICILWVYPFVSNLWKLNFVGDKVSLFLYILLWKIRGITYHIHTLPATVVISTHIVEIHKYSNIIVAMNAHNKKSQFSDVNANAENYADEVTKNKDVYI